MESPDCCIITTQACCKKGGYYGRQTFRLDIGNEYHCRDIFSRQVDLAYNSIPLLKLSLQSLIEFIQSLIKFIQRILWWYLDQQYINRKEKFFFSLLYHHIFPHSLWYLPKWYQDTQRTAVRNAAKAQGEVIAPGSIGRSSEGMLSWVCGSESKKRSRGQSERESQEEKDCREEEEENIGIPLTTPGQDTSREHCPFGEHWKIPDHEI